MDDSLRCTSHLILNIDDQDGLLGDCVLNVDPKDLFPENEKLNKEKEK